MSTGYGCGASTGKKEGLTLADVKDRRARRIVRGIERSMVHYGTTGLSATVVSFSSE